MQIHNAFVIYRYEINKKENFSVSVIIQCLSVVETNNIIIRDQCTTYSTPHSFTRSEHWIFIVLSGKSLYINDLESARCNSTDIRKFAKEAKEIGIQYIGLCCGNSASYFRELAETYGRTTPASKYSPDMTMNSIFGEEQNVVNPRAKKLMDFTLGYRK